MTEDTTKLPTLSTRVFPFTNVQTLERWFYISTKEMEDSINKGEKDTKKTSKGMSYHSPNVDSTFHVWDFFIYTEEMETKNNFEYEIVINYSITKCHPEIVHKYTLGPSSDIAFLCKEFLSFFWKYTTCPECLIGLRMLSEEVCSDCIPLKINCEFAVAEGFKSQIDGCPICLEAVYFSKLHCGHFIHKTCMVKLSEDEWYNEESMNLKPLKCPLCRTFLSSSDIKGLFTISSF